MRLSNPRRAGGAAVALAFSVALRATSDPTPDNCTQIENPSQLDTDDDGYGNACDGDFNNDWFTDSVDFPLLDHDFRSVGLDSTGSGTDMNGDGYVDNVDALHWLAQFMGATKPGPSALPCAGTTPCGVGSPMGPLVVSPSNPRYFERPDGRIVALAGSHTWENLIDQGRLADGDPPAPFDFDDYLDYLAEYGHNFTRLWVWENARWSPNNPDSQNFVFAAPLPYARTGPGNALDGKPKFDLNSFDEAYFQRLRDRVVRLRDRGMYAQIMLFQGWSIGPYGPAHGNPWPGSFYHRSNNVQGLDGDPNGDNDGREVNTLSASGDIPAIRARQEAYVRKVIDTLNDLPNVLYEIANEPTADSVTWQQHMVNVVGAYQAGKPQQHPVGMTGCVGGCDTGPNGGVYAIQGADFISLAGSLASNPVAWPANEPVSLADSDHYWLVYASNALVWQQFLRGHNVAHMDVFDCSPFANQATYHDCALPGYDPAKEEGALVAIGQIARLAPHLDLAHMVPSGSLSSDGYALADTPQAQKDVIAYTQDGALTLDLSSGSGQSWTVAWLDTDDGRTQAAGPVVGAASVALTSPYGGSSVVLLTQGSSQMSLAPID